ncbi:MAG: M48 family metalloprotease [Lentisphaerae bacterium]|nr:M48 family metalloprotease [Lentisphaerota bacterium]
MDFFESQDQARRKTSLLVAYYALAVVLIIIGVYLAFAMAFLGVEAKTGSGEVQLSHLWNPMLCLWVVGGTLAVVLLGSLYKVTQLSSGGEAVARMLGGQPIDPDRANAQERKVLNVVEEMAIASGLPVPPVFLMEDASINAFAAGFSPSTAVIGVTRGCIDQLTRDELQGVMAHEFSHILNGDMRLNIRLIGVLHGILIIALIGYGILRSTAFSRHRSRSSNDKNGGNMPIVVLGFVLMAVGYIGVFFGKLIKSAVSRQREFLADASAVQFTRNPQGIGGALKKIGGFSAGSRVESSHAEEASHFFFANGLSSSLLGLMASHPPLEERIQRIDASLLADVDPSSAARAPSPAASPLTSGIGGGTSFAVEPQQVLASVGAPRAAHLDYARQLLAALPEEVREAVHTPVGAVAAVYALLLSYDEAVRTSQLEWLGGHATAEELSLLRALRARIEPLGRAYRLPIADMCVVALRQLEPKAYRTFSECVEHLVAADQEVDLFEYALQQMLRRNLAPVFGRMTPTAIRHMTLEPLRDSCEALLSCLAHWGGGDTAEAGAAFAKGAHQLGGSLKLRPLDRCGLDVVDAALKAMLGGSHAVRKQILAGCVHTVVADNRVTVEEAELIRAVADALECPMPPLFGQS